MSKVRPSLIKKGRNVGSTRFVMRAHYIFDCPAYRTMKPWPRTSLWELIRLHNGSNNGRIGLDVRSAAQTLNMRKDMAAAYFYTLIERFPTLIERWLIAAARPGGFNMKNPQSHRASGSRLTWVATHCIAAVLA
jgi:hypothetical protein